MPGDKFEILSLGSFWRDGHTFVEWNSQPSGLGQTYIIGDTHEIVDEDVTLYAIWDEYAIGEMGPAGGIVFYDKGTYSNSNWRFLEAATEYSGSTYPWAPPEFENTEINHSSYGKPDNWALGDGGMANTLIIYLVMGDTGFMTGNIYAAYSVYWLFSQNGYSDWFLPTTNGLKELYQQRSLLSDYMEKIVYWSSNQYYSNQAYAIDFSTGEISRFYKDEKHRAWPIRKF